MGVHLEQARDQVFTGPVDDGGSRGDAKAIGRADPRNPTVPDQDRLMIQDYASGHGDHRDISDRGGTLCQESRGFRENCKNRKRELHGSLRVKATRGRTGARVGLRRAGLFDPDPPT